MASSSLGPAVRAGVAAPRSRRRRKCNGLNTRLITSKQARSKAATFQPPPRRGAAAAARRGGGSNGGGVGGLFGAGGGTLLSTTGKRFFKAHRLGRGSSAVRA